MDAASAEILALKALGFLAESEGSLNRFLSVSGLDAQGLRVRASEPEMLAAVMDFLLSDDGLLTGFCESEGIEPRTVHRMRSQLPGGMTA
jgi:hypothetical protein